MGRALPILVVDISSGSDYHHPGALDPPGKTFRLSYKENYLKHLNILNNMFGKICVIIGVIIFVSITTLIIGDRMMKSELDKDIENLFAYSKNISDKVYTSNQIKDLPIPVQRYFKYSLKENQPYVSYVRLQHGGDFKASKNWVSIRLVA